MRALDLVSEERDECLDHAVRGAAFNDLPDGVVEPDGDELAEGRHPAEHHRADQPLNVVVEPPREDPVSHEPWRGGHALHGVER